MKHSNSKATNHKLNRTVQTLLNDLVTTDRASSKALWAVKLTRELWKRQIWTDTKAVEIMKEASLAENEKVALGAIRFFLGGDKEREDLEDDSSDEEALDIRKLKHQIGINKKTKKKTRALESAVSEVKRKEKKKGQPHPLNFSAFHLLHDPQGFAEGLFSKHLQHPRSKIRRENQPQVLQLVSRLVGLHKLTIISLYSYFIKYLTPRQEFVTSYLASLAQATHSLVPPDALEPLVQKIANEFVSEGSASEVASAGLNAIRELCARQPLAITETLLQDLVEYRKSKDKGVVMAAKGLLSLYREQNPGMLKSRDRGKEAAMGYRSGERKERRFGEETVGEIEGLELLEKWKEEERQRKRAEKGLEDGDPKEEEEVEDEDEDGWEIDEADNSDDSGGWIDVQSDVDIDISDSDDDKPRKRQKKNVDEDKENSEAPTEDIEKKTSTLATSRILTPADFAKLQELRLEASVNKALPVSQRKRLAQQAALQHRHADDPLTATEIEGLAMLSKKNTKEEKIALAKAGKGDRAEHKSTHAIRQAKKYAEGKSSTNKEKARKKNFMMTLGKAKGKQKMSLHDRSKVLKAHIERGKHGGRRGNANPKK